jgi:hypothetical protein
VSVLQAQGGGPLGMAYGVGDQLRRQQLADVHQADQAVEGEDQADGTAANGDRSGVVGDVEYVLPGFVLCFWYV